MELINTNDFEIAAKLKLDQPIYDFIAGGAGDEYTLRRNSEEFKYLQLTPRIFQNKGTIQTNINLLNQELSQPLLVAPTAFHRSVHHLGEIATVNAVNEAGLGMILSTMSSISLEEVAKNANCLLWFQLYLYKDRSVTQQLINRAEQAGFKALVLTVDVPIMGTRERDKRNQLKLQHELLLGNFNGIEFTYASSENKNSNIKNYTDSLFEPCITWNDIEWIRAHTSLPLILKGIMHEQDALIALELGIAAIIISNHGGRQLDSMPATIEVLPTLAKHVGTRIPILIDGGFRRGTDVFKAIALGADCVMLGRSVLWALAVNGTDGVKNLFSIFLKELTEVMIFCGCQTIDDIKNHGKKIIQFKK